jgi:hypothetical protein
MALLKTMPRWLLPFFATALAGPVLVAAPIATPGATPVATPVATPAVSRPPQASQEYRIKAVFLFNFAQFVDWPPEAFATPQSPFVIGVLGDDPFDGVLEEAIRGESTHARPLSVQRFRRVSEIESCHILFISRSESSRLPEILAALKGRSILTVGEAENFARGGGMIRFVTDNNRIRLRVNVDAARAANLRISSKLLRPAEIIGTANPP